jgi:rifampicin phosphotransferase
VHFPRPATRYWAEVHPEAFALGTSDFARFYGMLLGGLEMSYINGFAYITKKPAPEEEIPQRFQRAEEVFAGKLWRDQLREWDETYKPNAIAKHRELQSVEPDQLSDEELVAYLGRCRDHHAKMITQHMRFTAGAVVPTGDFLAHVGDWTGVSHADLLGLMRGASPISAGASAELEQLIDAIARDPAAQELLASDDDPARVLERLGSLDSEAGAAVSAYLDLVGNRLLDGFDISNPAAIEMPDVLLRAIRIAAEGRGAEDSDVDDEIADVRRQVPEQHQGQFDELLGEARGNYRLRDERGVYSDIWASGIMRRAALAAGRRLAAKGRIHEPEHFVDAGFGEMSALLAGSAGLRPTSSRPAPHTAPGTAPRTLPGTSGPRLRLRRTPPGCHRRSGGSCVRRASRWARCSEARRQSTKRTCSAGWPPAPASTKGPRAASPGRRTSTGSSRETFSSRRRPRRRSTSCCPCSGRS